MSVAQVIAMLGLEVPDDATFVVGYGRLGEAVLVRVMLGEGGVLEYVPGPRCPFVMSITGEA